MKRLKAVLYVLICLAAYYSYAKADGGHDGGGHHSGDSTSHDTSHHSGRDGDSDTSHHSGGGSDTTHHSGGSSDTTGHHDNDSSDVRHSGDSTGSHDHDSSDVRHGDDSTEVHHDSTEVHHRGSDSTGVGHHSDSTGVGSTDSSDHRGRHGRGGRIIDTTGHHGIGGDVRLDSARGRSEATEAHEHGLESHHSHRDTTVHHEDLGHATIFIRNVDPSIVGLQNVTETASFRLFDMNGHLVSEWRAAANEIEIPRQTRSGRFLLEVTVSGERKLLKVQLGQ
jgi:hypothetical protein